MKTAILTFAIILSVCGVAAAQTEETLTINSSQQKQAGSGKLNIRFISVLEDSRCPVRAVCVWAGNARVRIEVSMRHRPIRIIELNTGLDPRIVKFEGYEFKLLSVAPRPGENERDKIARPAITISVKRV